MKRSDIWSLLSLVVLADDVSLPLSEAGEVVGLGGFGSDEENADEKGLEAAEFVLMAADVGEDEAEEEDESEDIETGELGPMPNNSDV